MGATVAELSVKIYGGLLPVARRDGHATPLAMWLMARGIDRSGRGRLDLAKFHEATTAYYSRATFYRHIKTGERLGFWEIIDLPSGKRQLKLTGLLALARAQQLPSIGGKPILMSAARLVGVANIRAAHYAALLTSHATHTTTNQAANQFIGKVRKAMVACPPGPERERYVKLIDAYKRQRQYANPISQSVLAELGAPTRRTQTRYKRLLPKLDSQGGGLRVKHNMARTGKDKSQLRAMREIHGGYFLYGNDVVRRLPDNYLSSLPRSSASFVRKVNRQLGSLLLCGDGATRAKRLFFNSGKKAESAKSELQFVRSKAAYGGMRLWDEKREAPADGHGLEAVPNLAAFTDAVPLGLWKFQAVAGVLVRVSRNCPL
jgi:hypothetical protein